MDSVPPLHSTRNDAIAPWRTASGTTTLLPIAPNACPEKIDHLETRYQTVANTPQPATVQLDAAR